MFKVSEIHIPIFIMKSTIVLWKNLILTETANIHYLYSYFMLL